MIRVCLKAINKTLKIKLCTCHNETDLKVQFCILLLQWHFSLSSCMYRVDLPSGNYLLINNHEKNQFYANVLKIYHVKALVTRAILTPNITIKIY